MSGSLLVPIPQKKSDCAVHGSYNAAYGKCPRCTGGPKTDKEQIIEHLDALRQAVTARNQQISSLSEQVRLGFEASTSQQNAAAARAENLAAELKALSTRVHDIQQFQFDRAGALRDILTTIEQELSALESGLVEHDAYAKALNEKMASSEYVKVTNQMREFMGAIALHVANGEMEIKHKSAQLQHNQQLKAKKAARKRSK